MSWGDSVMYGPNIKRIKSILSAWYKNYQEFFEDTRILNDINRNEHIIMSALRYDIYPFLKLNKDPYTRESEYRVVCAVTDKELINSTDDGRLYYEIRLPKSSIHKIDFSRSISIAKIQDIVEQLNILGYTTEHEGRSITFNKE